MTLREVIITIILGAISSLLAAELNDYCKETYRCGFVKLIYLKALVTWNCAVDQARVIANLLTQATRYTKGRVSAGIPATKDWIVFETKLYRSVLEGWWSSVLNFYSKSRDNIHASLTSKKSFLPEPQLFPLFSSHLVRVAMVTAIVMAILLLPPFLQKTHKDTSPQPTENTFPRPRLIAERALEQLDPGPGEWTYRGARYEDQGTSLEIFHNGQKAFSYNGYFLDFITFADQAEEEYPGIFVEGAGEIDTKDITGGGIPDVLLVEDCGCSAGTMTYTLLSLDQQVKETFSTDDWIGEMQWRLGDIDGDGVYEAIGPEFPMMIREEGFKWVGPGIEVILKYDKGDFTFASDLMRRKPPARSEFLAEVEKAKQELSDYEILLDTDSDNRKILSDFAWEYVINLIYTGNGEMAREFINLVFSDKAESQRNFFWMAFYTDLTGAPYWSQIAAMNHWSVDQYAFKGPTC